MTTPSEPKGAGAGEAVFEQASTEGPINANRGWNQLTHTLGHKMPSRLHAADRARQSLLDTMKGKGTH